MARFFFFPAFSISFAEKTMDRLTAAAMLLLVQLTACSPDDAVQGVTPRTSRETLEREMPSRPEGNVLYAAGVEFPLSYDWRKDSAYGDVAAKIVVFAKQKRILEIPAGKGGVIDLSADRNRLIKGRLYSYSLTDGMTSVLRDGKELFRYAGRENITGIIDDGENVHTLGEAVSGPGFSYRRNGEKIFADISGKIAGSPHNFNDENGTLHEDGGVIYFSFFSPERHGWYLVKDGVAEAIPITKGISAIHDIRLFGGGIHILAADARSGDSGIYIHGKSSIPLVQDYSVPRRILYGSLCLSGRKVFIKTMQEAADGIHGERLLWDSDGKPLPTGGEGQKDYWMYGGKAAAVCTGRNSEITEIRIDGKSCTLNDRAKLMTPSAACYRNGSFCVAASPFRKELNPFVWENGKTLSYSLNGYIFDLSACP